MVAAILTIVLASGALVPIVKAFISSKDSDDSYDESTELVFE